MTQIKHFIFGHQWEYIYLGFEKGELPYCRACRCCSEVEYIQEFPYKLYLLK